MTQEETQIIELKYKSKQIGELSEGDLSKWGKALLGKIHVITGWTIPGDESLTTILVDQFQKILVERYSMLNPDEIEFAFRQTGISTPDYGKAMNLNLICSVLTPYADNRFELSETERYLNTKKDYEQKIFTQDELDNSAREDAERQYQMFLNGYSIKNYQINKEILVKDGLMNLDQEVIDFFISKKDANKKNIYERVV